MYDPDWSKKHHMPANPVPQHSIEWLGLRITYLRHMLFVNSSYY